MLSLSARMSIRNIMPEACVNIVIAFRAAHGSHSIVNTQIGKFMREDCAEIATTNT